MEVRLASFLIDAFNPEKNIEKDIDWIIGYSNPANMRNLDFLKINLISSDYKIIELPEAVCKMISREIDSEALADIEKATNLFYMCLYVLGGRN